MRAQRYKLLAASGGHAVYTVVTCIRTGAAEDGRGLNVAIVLEILAGPPSSTTAVHLPTWWHVYCTCAHSRVSSIVHHPGREPRHPNWEPTVPPPEGLLDSDWYDSAAQPTGEVCTSRRFPASFRSTFDKTDKSKLCCVQVPYAHRAQRGGFLTTLSLVTRVAMMAVHFGKKAGAKRTLASVRVMLSGVMIFKF